ncbi:D-Ala-D-Ala carboxypeptidase family metallohydrolase [Comamonas terrigena]|uniref:D-Ala-D-Ala carboxypeptidase family metallohydrolase n=1 Tax=Comamonas terrigena TaxID=32013 RepID=UPI0028AA05F7|nr:D-Ala-D-Ala carboxypeptidase family metallohydrolase [Comamonas terrigena]
MQLTPHFSLSEFTRSAKATALGLDNTPTPMAQTNLLRTAQMLERVRAQLGGHAVIVTSGYRGREVNQAVGGATSSDHQAGQAADIQVPGFGKPYDVAKALVPHLDALGIGQLAYESDGASQWVHVSTRVQSKPVNRVITIAVGRGTYLGIQHV